MLRTESWIVVGAWLLAACGPPREMTWPDTGSVETGVDASDTGRPADAGSCRSNTDCDDQLPCTMDLCLIGGVCQHMSSCPSGQFCGMTGCTTSRTCSTNADCDDMIACTHDICATGGVCQSVRDDSLCDTSTMQTCSVALGCIAQGRCGADADCDDARRCNGAEHCMLSGGSGTCAAGTPVTCDDMDACTADTCNETGTMCTHTPLMPCGGTVQTGTYALSPPPSFTCANGTIGPVNTIVLTATASSVTVTGFGSTLTGGAPSMGMFSVSGPWSSSGCGGTIALSGSFTMPGHFMGSWSLTAGTCDISCNSFFALTNGTIQP